MQICARFDVNTLPDLGGTGLATTDEYAIYIIGAALLG